MRPLVLQLCYLTGRCVATAYNDRERAEWPPHPARVYFALVATWAESEERSSAERDALEWLATLEAPSICASEASHRQVVPHFVPVNDASVLDPFERQRERLDAASRAHEESKAKFEAKRGATEKDVALAAKQLARCEKAEGAERKKLEQAMVADQQPFAPGKHPATGLASATALIPEHRGKQPRCFPSVSPEDPRVFFRWDAEADDVERHGQPLASLASRVVRVGHSGSLVSCSVVDDSPPPTWEPNENGEEVLRIPGPGQFQQLEDAFARHQEVEPRVLPCRFRRYGRMGRASPEPLGKSCFGDDWLVFRQTGGRRLSQTAGVDVARAMRGALLKYCDDPSPELLSGHAESGAPSETPHLAVVPLPFVGNPHSTGDLLGLALIFPRGADDAQRHAVLRAIGLWEKEQRHRLDDDLVETPPLELTLGQAGVLTIERIDWGGAPLKTLRSPTWCRPSSSWVTATPIALDRNPGDLFSRDPDKAAAAYEAAEQCIATACERIGLPKPKEVQVHPSVPLVGSVKARTYPAFPRGASKNQRVKVHARLEFPARVSGPILLGAGRYYGLGLCLPQPAETRAEA